MNDEVFSSILIQAVEYDKNGKLDEALTCYKEGENDPGKLAHYQAKVSEYFKRAEDLKAFLKRKKELGDHVHIDIREGDINYGYKTIFTKYMDSLITSVKINDPYIRNKHHTVNLLKFFELLISGCVNLKKIELLTTADPKEANAQQTRFDGIKTSLKNCYGIEFIVMFSNTLHDRSIWLSNGWCIKIGRGLDYFRPCDCWCPGYFDLDLRPCRETSIDVFYHPGSENE